MKSSFLFTVILALSVSTFAADNLRLNQKLDYSSDSQDGPLISGDHLQDGPAAGKPNYVIIYGEGCYNSKRQARRTVSLWEKYKGRVNFVVVDLDQEHSPAQQELVKKYYRGYIPHVVVLDSSGGAVYNSSGEVDESTISSILDKALL
ncbi:MAG: hypothetical protein DMG68_05950 [Acidobacteria bacterium]|jgi:hypothetical protein|nr:MAG: hypothetical protein DMG68_05950 [Acidobacteriota bacterium]